MAAIRGTESPMDFEWQGSGPVDVTSPYHKFIMESQGKKRPYSQLNSPMKATLPSLSGPNGKPWFFSDVPTSPSPPSQTSPFRAPSFTTPRKPFDIDFSSGPETSSPVGATENDDTPDAKSPFEFTSNPDRDHNSKPSKKRNSLWNMYGPFAPSPETGKRALKPFNDTLERRIHKRRRRAQHFDSRELILRRNSEDTSDDEESTPNAIAKQSRHSASKQWPQQPLSEAFQPPKQGKLGTFFTYLHTHPHLPMILSHYLQLLTNLLILSFIIFLLYNTYATISSDLTSAADAASAGILSEMSTCSKQYIDNQCGSDRRLPALETMCNEWELCMNRDPQAVRRASLSARTFAQIFDSFVEEISLRTLGFTVVLVVVSVVVSNGMFVAFRRQFEDSPYMKTQSHGYHSTPYPQTPGRPGIHHAYTEPAPSLNSPGGQRQVSWQDANHSAFNVTQRQLGYGEFSASPTKEYGGRGRSRSPQKR